MKSMEHRMTAAMMIFIMAAASTSAFAPFLTTSSSMAILNSKKNLSPLFMSSEPPPPPSSEDNDDEADDEGTNLAAEFAALAKIRNIGLEEEELDYDEDDDDDDDGEDDSPSAAASDVSEDDDDDDDDEEEVNIPEGAIAAFLDSNSGGQEGDLSNKQVYDELRERVLESAGGFVELVGGTGDDDDDDDEEGGGAEKPYETPTTVPDSGLTAGEVITTVLDALRHNDIPTPNRGVEVLFGYSSPTSQISELQDTDGLTPAEYADFLKETNEYGVLFDHAKVFIDKADYSFDRKRAFFTARLSKEDSPGSESTNVNFILSTNGQEEDDCWLIDSMLIRPEGMRRRRRR